MAWAHNGDPNKLNWGSRAFDGDRPSRLGAIMRLVPCIMTDALVHFNAVVYETPFVRGRDATRSLWGIAGIIEGCANAANIAVLDIAVPTIKKFATGSGHGPKIAMIEAAQRMGYRGDNEHEADAVCLLRYAEANLENVSPRR
jgi:Holliday junction resolvasome RuvABC endonuclease subunit